MPVGTAGSEGLRGHVLSSVPHLSQDLRARAFSPGRDDAAPRSSRRAEAFQHVPGPGQNHHGGVLEPASCHGVVGLVAVPDGAGRPRTRAAHLSDAFLSFLGHPVTLPGPWRVAILHFLHLHGPYKYIQHVKCSQQLQQQQ